jgi:hypothetical protein
VSDSCGTTSRVAIESLPNTNIKHCNVTNTVSKPKARFYHLHDHQRLRNSYRLLHVKRSAILA